MERLEHDVTKVHHIETSHGIYQQKDGTAKDAPNVSSSWDDDDFELQNPDLSKAMAANHHHCAEESFPAPDREEWMQTLKEQQQQQASLSQQRTDGEIYLTKQFKALHTPACKKKNRCAQCTRPLIKEGNNNESNHLCPRCSNK